MDKLIKSAARPGCAVAIEQAPGVVLIEVDPATAKVVAVVAAVEPIEEPKPIDEGEAIRG